MREQAQRPCRNGRRHTSVGFDAVDVHMTDLLAEWNKLDGFTGDRLRRFSYGDVGRSTGWAVNPV